MSVRLVVSAAVALLTVGCGSASFDSFGMIGPSSDAGAETDDDVALPDAPLPDDTAQTNSDAGQAPPPCVARADGLSNLCVRVTKGNDPPPITSNDADLGIDGYGMLTVGLSKTPPRKASDIVAFTTLPSVTSGAKLEIANLPMVAEIGVPPGVYFVVATFRDAAPFDRAELQIGDWIPRAVDPKDFPLVDLGNPAAPVAIDLPIFPVRGFDVEAKLASNVKPIGSGAGPVRVRMSGTGGGKLGIGTLSCGDVASGGVATVRVLTAAAPVPFTLEGALFDFASGADDPQLDAYPIAAGTLMTTGPTAPEPLCDGWLCGRKSIELGRVIPFLSAVPADPTTACYGVALKQ